MLFVQKWPFFQLFFVRQYWPGKFLLRYSRTKKNSFLGYKKQKFKPSKNWHFSKGVNPWLWSKNAFFQLFFFRQYGPGKCFLRYSRTKKTPFWAIKTRSLKSWKIDIFPKGLTHRFGPKMAISPKIVL